MTVNTGIFCEMCGDELLIEHDDLILFDFDPEKIVNALAGTLCPGCQAKRNEFLDMIASVDF